MKKIILSIDGMTCSAGDILALKPGEKIAVDGMVLEGKAHLDESFIKGGYMLEVRN